jgi:hypothetical protein
VLLLYAIVAGLVLGRLSGGRLRNLEHLHFTWWPLAVGGLAVQVVLFARPVAERVGSEGPAIYVLSTLAVMAALLRNLSRPGLVVIAVGAALNLVAVLANGGAMPSSPEAWLALNGVAELPVSHFSNSTLIGPDTLVPFLGDIFVWPRPLPLANVFSIGDVVIAVGTVMFLVGAMRTSAPPTGDRMPEDGPTETPAAALPHAR